MTDQTTFRTAVLDPGLPAPGGLITPEGTRATRRFDVYRNNVAVSLTEALETAFPALRALVGEEFFKAMSGVYLRRHLPSSPLLMDYGNHMPAFLETFAPAASLPYLPDIARLEIALRASYHAADARPLDPAGIPPQELMDTPFFLVPSARLVVSAYPLLDIYTRARNTDAPRPGAAAQDVLVTRPGFDPAPDCLPRGAARFVAAFARGCTIPQALEGLDLDPAETLTLLLSRQALTLQG